MKNTVNNKCGEVGKTCLVGKRGKKNSVNGQLGEVAAG